MSFSYFIYSTDEAVPTRSMVARHLHERGWTVVFVDSDDITHVLPDGPVSNDLIIGCQSQKTADRMMELIKKNDKAELEKLYGQNRFTSCAVWANANDFEESYGEADVEDLTHSIGQEAVDTMRRANNRFEVFSSAGRSVPTYRFQEEVWEALGDCTRHGLMEDPQTGKLQFCDSGERRVLETCLEAQNDPSDLHSLFGSFMEEARKRGFPGRGQGGNAEVVTDELDLNQMEQLLDLALRFNPPEAPLFLNRMLLEEYVSHQDASFEVEYKDWIEAMKNGGKGASRSTGWLRRLFGRNDADD